MFTFKNFAGKEDETKMIKNKLEITEDEILSDDGIFAAKYNTIYDNAEKCCQCGFAIMPGEDAVQIYVNGDVIHKQCWQDYADENAGAFGKDFVCDDDDNRDI